MSSTQVARQQTGVAAAGQTMRALVKERPGPGLTLAERPVPSVGPGDVLIGVRMAGICGTDAHIWGWDEWAANRVKPPLIVGHEFMGEVAAVGNAVRTLRVGDRVSAEGHIPDRTCRLCRTGQSHICASVKVIGVDRDGCFADYIAMPEANVWKLDAGIPDEWAAIFDPFGNAVHTVSEAGVSQRAVLVTGAGSIGLMSVAVARAAGATQIIITDPNPHKLELAKKLGATLVLPSDAPDMVAQVRAATGGEGADVLLEMSGNSQAIDVGLEALRPGGRAALLGIPSQKISFDLAERVVLKGVTLIGIFGRKMFETWYQMQALVGRRLVDLSPIITHVVPFERFEECFTTLKKGDAIKMVLDLRRAR